MLAATKTERSSKDASKGWAKIIKKLYEDSDGQLCAYSGYHGDDKVRSFLKWFHNLCKENEKLAVESKFAALSGELDDLERAKTSKEAARKRKADESETTARSNEASETLMGLRPSRVVYDREDSENSTPVESNELANLLTSTENRLPAASSELANRLKKRSSIGAGRLKSGHSDDMINALNGPILALQNLSANVTRVVEMSSGQSTSSTSFLTREQEKTRALLKLAEDLAKDEDVPVATKNQVKALKINFVDDLLTEASLNISTRNAGVALVDETSNSSRW